MKDTDNKPTTPPAADPEPTAQPAAPAPQEQIDVNQVKSMLDLPETATDLELITVLVNLVATLQEKYEGLLQDAVAMEDRVLNRDLADYADVIDNASQPFWKEQILQNRTMALETLETLRQRLTPAPAPAAPVVEERVIPLRNRLAAIERTVANVAEPPAAIAPERDMAAFRIRNRAHEIAKAEGVPFIIAFDRAENEINTGDKQ